MTWETALILESRRELNGALPVYRVWPLTVNRRFGYYRDCEFRLADALERSVKPLRDTGDFVLMAAVAAEETAERVYRIVGPAAVADNELRTLFNFPRIPARSRVIFRFPYIKVMTAR